MSFSVAGKSAIVTGVTSGVRVPGHTLQHSSCADAAATAEICLVFAKLLASNGCRVVVADLHKIPALTGFIDANGRPWSNFWTDAERSSYATIDINLGALMGGTRLAIRDQVTRSPTTMDPISTFTATATTTPSTITATTTGIILNISSLAAQFALLNQPLYGASKTGVSSFTRSLAPLHVLFGIKVVTVAPCMVNTPLWTKHLDRLKAVSWNKADEVANVMLRLVEPAEYAGGTVLEVLAEGRTRRVEVDSLVAEGRGATMSNMHLVTRDTVEILRREQAAGVGAGGRSGEGGMNGQLLTTVGGGRR